MLSNKKFLNTIVSYCSFSNEISEPQLPANFGFILTTSGPNCGSSIALISTLLGSFNYAAFMFILQGIVNI